MQKQDNVRKKVNCRYFLKGVWADKKAMFVAVVLICSFLNLAYMHVTILGINSLLYYRFNTQSVLFAMVDIFAIYLLPLLLARKKMGTFLAIYLFLTLIAWINVGYSRYFHTYLPLSLYFAVNNLNGLSNNILDAIEKNDFFFLFTSIIVVLAFVLQKRFANSRLTHHYPLLFLFLGILYLSIPILANVEKERKRQHEHFKELHEHRTFSKSIQDWFVGSRINSQTEAYFNFGLLTNYAYEIFHKDKNIEYPKRLIAYLMTESNYQSKTKSVHRNTILILVESLSSYALNKEYGGREVTPFLNKLAYKGAAFTNMESETQLGESSDGQFIYMTGYLPIKDDVTINSVANNRLLTLAHFFKAKNGRGGTSRMIIPTDQNAWSQATMCKVYGIDTLYSRDNYNGTADKWLNDEQLFKYAANKDIKSDKPFFSIILTSSTHSPWNKRFEDVDIPFPSNFSSELKTYLANVHYMDKWLGWYIESLKAKGIYDDTTIIIVADHKPNAPKLNIPDLNMCADIPFIIVNSPIDIATPSDERIYQTSVFPTILDLWGVDSDWRGVGYSLLYGG